MLDCLPSPLRESVTYHYGRAGKDGGRATGDRGGTGRKVIAFTLLCAGVDGGPVLAEFYHGQDEPTQDELAAVANMIDRCGGRAWTRE